MALDWTVLVLVLTTMVERSRSAATLPPLSVVETELNSPLQNDTAEEHAMHFSTNWPDDIQLGCQELRAKRFVSDGFCTSLKPINEIVCSGQCMPIKEQNLPWWAEFTKYWANPKFREWRCVEAATKLQKVQLMCSNGETRTYQIKIVNSCRCKSYEREPNRTDNAESKRMREKRQNKDKKRKRKEQKQEEKRLRINRKVKQEKGIKALRRVSRGESESVPVSRHRPYTKHNHKFQNE